jgi:hypothetical protein
MPRWPANHKRRTDRNYAAETAYESEPTQKKRRASRTRARYHAEKQGKVHKGDGKELDHIGYHPTGTLAKVPTKVVSRTANRKRQPPHKGYGRR